MNCKDYQKEILLFYADELPPERKTELDQHLQICFGCAKFSNDILNTVDVIKKGRLPKREIDFWPYVHKRITVKHHLISKWILVPLISMLLIGLMFTKTFFHIPVKATCMDMEIVHELGMIIDYEFLEDLEILENNEFV